MSDDVARRECEALARSLPHGLRFDALVMHEYGGRRHRVASFSRGDIGDLVEFVLVPGGEVSLGFDGRDFRPSARQIESFAESANAYDLDSSINSFVDSQTSARRVASVAPMLIEFEARPVEPRQDVEPLSPGDPMFVERSSGALRVGCRPPTTVPYVVERLAETGMRLPTCDEWENACGGGATTLFRWGDDSPMDFYPTDTCAEDRDRKRVWALSLGKLAYKPAPAKWTWHLRPNLFGLRIANDPYRSDLVSDGPLALGGDGGCNICGGAGFFLGWLPLASAFRNPYGPVSPHEDVADDYHRVRRVIPIE